MSPWPSSWSAPFTSRITRLSILLDTMKAMRVGRLALIRPVITLVLGRCVARMMWMPTARLLAARRVMDVSTSLAAVIIRSASSSTMITMNGRKRGKSSPSTRSPKRSRRPSTPSLL